MEFSLREQVPIKYETIYKYTKDRRLTEKNLKPYLLNLETRGVTWKTLELLANRYIDDNDLHFDDCVGGPSLDEPTYLYAHTISEFAGTTLKNPTVIYVGISSVENVGATNEKQHYKRAFTRSRTRIWKDVLKYSGKHTVHIFPYRLESKACNEIEMYLIDLLGRFFIPEPYKGALLNLMRNPIDCYHLQQSRKTWLKNNPHKIGKGGVISLQKQLILANEDINQKVGNRMRERFTNITDKEKKEYIEPSIGFWPDFNDWKNKLLKQYAHKHKNLLNNGNWKKIKITPEYTKQLQLVQNSGVYHRVFRPDRAQQSGIFHGQEVIFPEYRENKIKAYLGLGSSTLPDLKKTNNLSSVGSDTEVSVVFSQWDGFWVPNYKALIEEFKLENSRSEAIPTKEREITPAGAEIQKKFDEAIASIEELGDFEEWIVKTLKPYKHDTDYGSQHYPSHFLENPHYIRAFQKIETRKDIFFRSTRGSRIKSYGDFGEDLIYLETSYIKGPCWAPSKKLLKKLYKQEKIRINKLKYEALQKAGLVDVEIKKPEEYNYRNTTKPGFFRF